MKRIIFSLFFLLSVVVFTSCDDEPLEGFELAQANTNMGTNQGTSDDLVGTWKLVSWNTTNPVDINNDGTSNTNLLVEFNCYNNETIVFNSNNTAVNMSTSYADIELELVVGTTNEYNFSVDCVEEIENTNLTWAQSGNIIALTDTSGQSNNFSLNTDELSFLIPSGFTVVSGDGMVTVTEDLTLVYQKQ